MLSHGYSIGTWGSNVCCLRLDSVNWICRFKGTVHPKMKILFIYSSSSRSKPVWMCLFWKIFWRMRETEQYFSPTIEVNGAPKQPDYKSSKYLPLCSEQTHSHRFGSTWGWVNDDRILICNNYPFNVTSDSISYTYYRHIQELNCQFRHRPFLGENKLDFP